jgi:hypothetical protein
MLNKDQKQNVGDGATAVQAGENVTIMNIGVSVTEVREIAMDVARATFYELTGIAKEIASERVEEITDKVIEKLEREFPAGLQKARDPDFQYALFTIQKEYARNGDGDLGDLLVDLLVDRSKQDQRDILQIVLNESLKVAPKLTGTQLAALAIIFLFKYTQNHSVGNHVLLGEYFDKHILLFLDKLVKNQACYQHLEFSGCGSGSIAGNKLENIIGSTYQGLFLKGFDKEEIKKRKVSIGMDQRFFMSCLNDPKKIQVRANNKDTLEENLDKFEIEASDKENIVDLFNLNRMSNVEIKEKCIEIRPYMKTVFDIWNDSLMQNFTLTSVGISIGHANIKRFVGEFSDLSIWIN